MATTAVLCQTRRKRIPAKDVAPRIILRGNLLCFASGKAFSPPPPGAERSEITRFTRASRLRMLKYAATINYAAIGNSSFLTLTYPPCCEDRGYKQRTRDREALVRQLEKYHGGPISGLWRTEWKVRQSGPTKGNIAPHIHLLLFAVRYIPRGLIVVWWNKILKSETEARVDIRRVVGKKGAAFYISKYVGKATSPCLVNAPYLRKISGRHWGYLRGRRIPRWPEETIANPTPNQLSYIYRLARAVFPAGDIRVGESFTLFGDFVAEAGKLIRKKGLTEDVGEC